MKRSRLIIAALVAAGLAGGAVWYVLAPTEVAVATPKRGDAADVVYATGVVEPRTWAKVTPLVRERIVELCNCEGEEVAADTVIARLDAREAQATLAELEARMRLAREDMERLSVLVERNVASRQALDRAQSEVAQLEASVAGQTARLESYVLRAPMDGVVLRQDGEVGEIAEPGDVLFWVGRPQPLLVVANVNEEDVPAVEPRQRTLLRGDAFPDHTLEGTVDSVTPKGDPVTKTYRVRVALPADTPLLIGMTVNVNIVTRVSENALLVPAASVNGNHVFVVDGRGRAQRRQIEAGIRGITDVEILGGLDEDARVVTPFPEGLSDGARVRVREG